ncbi:ABC transporter substrate-binding protein [Thermomonospora umbrina]|uniref:Iron complex transport system substrate-binding protein n=1 Tax=Thermomonospora umbrina TaxID=111806 RepID=A0A3D9T2B0_9ACTN|nr:iron-siderophore ABC transporter substrate-binding protein [Thermomonospora umbrina]REE99385.1 iron complex transport system substrate-binding protein [Thermomonospora umbrina]
MQRLFRALAIGCTAVVTLSAAACGGSVDDQNNGGSGGGQGGGGAITVATARGPVALAKPATRVVSLEWVHTEELLALGVTPVGNADGKTYGEWVTAPGAALPAGVADVGTRQEPSLEKIRALSPDLIVVDEERSKNSYDQLKAIAPVVSFTYTDKPQLRHLKTTFTELAKAVGKEQRAAEVFARIDTTATAVRARLTKAGKAGSEYALAMGFSLNGTPTIRLLGDDALAAQVLNLAGLKNGWKGKPDAWGMTTVGVEGLTKVPASATFLYTANPKDDPFTGELKDNAVWKDLGFVKGGRVTPIDPGTWYFGGPLSAVHLLEEAAKAFKS